MLFNNGIRFDKHKHNLQKVTFWNIIRIKLSEVKLRLSNILFTKTNSGVKD